ncbi:MAG: M20/M25/M40 family metallo-hydrolase, partial [Clostridia bacterium]|nr:M20/M25/M40 family metallo-hydrolase [Clostridia bacterium]
IDPRVLISKRVVVGDDNIPGVIGAVAIHLQSAADRARVMGYRDIAVDIGAMDKKEAERKAPIGTYISFDTPYVEYGEGYACGKAFDDRVGCWTILRLLDEDLPCDLIAAFVSEEEVGCRGASGAAFSQEPDIGIVLEGTTCNDLGDIPEVAQVCKTGEGVAVSFMDGSSIANRDLFKKALEVGEKEGIACQVKASVSGGNDGGVIQRAREGIPVVVLSVPCRYIHSPSTVVKLSDVEAQFELCRALLKTM